MNGLMDRLAASGGDFDRWEIVYSERLEGLFLYVLVALVAALLASAVSDIRAGGARGVLLVLLRLAAVGAIAVAAAGPRVQLQKTQPIRNQLVVYFDQSPSMEIPDANGGAERREAVTRWLAAGGLPLDQWRENYDIRMLGFSGSGDDFRIAPLPGMAGEGASLPVAGFSTDFSSLLVDMARRIKDQPTSGVVIVSDGADLSGLSEATRRENVFADRLRQAGLAGVNAPVSTVLVGGEEPIPDVAISSLEVDDYAFIRNQAEITIHVRTSGISAQRLPVQLRFGGGVIAQTQVQVPDSGAHTLKATLSFSPQEVGEFIYEVQVPPVEVERIRDNNKKAFILNVIRDRIRVLQVVGHPSWDVRFLRQLFKRDPNIDLISFMILRDLAQVRMQNFPERDLSLIPFPTDEIFDRQLPSFDVVIMQNFQYQDHYGINLGHLENMRKFVAEQGGGLVLIGGDQGFSDTNFNWAAIRDLMPFERFQGAGLLDMGRVYETAPFAPELSQTGRIHPMTRLVSDPDENEKLWKRLPPVEGMNLTGPLKPDAFSLMNHPRLKYPDGRPMSLVAGRQYSKGRVLSVAGDSSWFWAFPAAAQEGTARHYATFWREALRWLTKDPSSQRVQVTTPRRQYRPGEEMRVRVSVLDEQYRPAEQAIVDLKARGISSMTGNICPQPVVQSGPGVFETTCIAEGKGFLSIWSGAKSSSGLELGSDTAFVEVLSPVAEYERTRVETELMDALANRLGGRSLRIEKGRTDGVPSVKPVDAFRVLGAREVELWDNGFVLLVLAALLSVEWFLRRQWGLA